MLLDNLKTTYLNNKDKSPAFLRNVLKETIQYYVLDFVYQSAWGEDFLFKGGTCLRFCFNFPRLSEDLDFDIKNFENFNLQKFAEEIKNHFIKTLQFSKLAIKLAQNERIIYLKLPILEDLGMNIKKHETNILFVRLDLAKAVGTKYKTAISIKSTWDFSILIKRYSLSDLFAGKLSAILTRKTIDGKIKKERLKGRDFFDLIWFLEKEIRPNWDYFQEITGLTKNEAFKKLTDKTKKVKPKFLESDLIPFFEDIHFARGFARNFHELFKTHKKILN